MSDHVPQRPVTPSTADSDWESIATYTRYADAQRAVDHLADKRFQVEVVRIVGTDVRLVEQVLGRLSWGRAAGGGAAAGAWLGLLFGLLLLILVSNIGVFEALLWGLLWGALFGATLAVVSYAMTGGARDFISRRDLQPQHYDVQARREHAANARQVLAEL
ncbi:MAG TPA: general stress protein [Actinomycetes bacterium]|nr:general stress protein [Actinomycetes bacterium]